MYVRHTDPLRSVKVPENYGGNAFFGKERHNDMPPPIRPSPSLPASQRHGSEDAMRSDLPLSERQNALMNDPYVTEEPHAPIGEEFFRENGQPEVDEEPQPQHDTPTLDPSDREEAEGGQPTTKERRPSSLLSAFLPPAASSSHFPFGHGLGSEELLILAIMLLILLSGNEKGESDNEALLLLGFLLFAG